MIGIIDFSIKVNIKLMYLNILLLLLLGWME